MFICFTFSCFRLLALLSHFVLFWGFSIFLRCLGYGSQQDNAQSARTRMMPGLPFVRLVGISASWLCPKTTRSSCLSTFSLYIGSYTLYNLLRNTSHIRYKRLSFRKNSRTFFHLYHALKHSFQLLHGTSPVS